MNRRLFPWWFTFFVVLQGLDVWTTKAALARGVGREVNPFMVAVVEQPVLVLYGLKALMLIVVVAAWQWFTDRDDAAGFWFAAVPLTVFYIAVVVNNLAVVQW